jgi:hypothetical protein
VSEVGVACARGNDQVIVGKLALGNLYNSAFEIKIVYFSQYNLDVATAGEDPADGRCDFAGRQPGGCDLIEQRLEGVVVSAVDYRNPDRMAIITICGIDLPFISGPRQSRSPFKIC